MSTKRATDLKLGSHHIKNMVDFEVSMKKQGFSSILDRMSKEHLRSTLMKLRFPKKTAVNKLIDLNDSLRKAIPESIPQGTPPTPEPGSAEKKAKAKMVKEMNKLGEARYDPDARELTGLPFAGVDYESAKASFERKATLQKSMKSRGGRGGRRTRKSH
jgi:hypothetical protein